MIPLPGRGSPGWPSPTAAVVDAAVAAAARAAVGWREASLATRTRVLFAFRQLLEAHKKELAEILTREHGKVAADALGEVNRGLEVVEFACGLPQLVKGEFSENVSTDVDSYSIRQPLGVVAGITPFNFPAMVPMWMYPIAIACGNAFILKPSEKDPSAANFSARLLAEAGLPEGVFNVVHGDKAAVDAILAHPGIQAVSFVGSTPIAKYIYETGTRSGKRVQALGGAKNHMVVLPDADLELAADSAVSAAYGSAGERCMAISVLVTVGDVADRLLPKIRERIHKLKVAPGTEPGAEMGPLVTRDHHAKVVSYVEKGEKEGATLLEDGRKTRVPGHERGFFLGPCLFDDVKPQMSIYTDEIFGPVLSVVRAGSYDEALCSRERQPLRQRRRHLHERRGSRPAVPERGPGGHGRRQRPDPGADGLLLVRRLEELALRRLARPRARGDPLLHARQGGDEPLARPPPPRREPRLPADEVGRKRRSHAIAHALTGPRKSAKRIQFGPAGPPTRETYRHGWNTRPFCPPRAAPG